MAKLNFAAYARHRGVTPAAVTKAVATGRISTEVDPRSGRRVIDSDRADREWDENTDRAKQEGSAAHLKRPSPAAPTSEIQPDEPTTQAPPALPPSDPVSASASIQLSRARREHFNAELARLKFERESGKLVEADQVQRRSFDTARIVRESMLNIPDRVAAQLAGETDARRIHELLTGEITKALEAVAENG